MEEPVGWLRSTYDKPPYWMVSNVKSCGGLKQAVLGPEAFGVTCNGADCSVDNAKVLRHFLPDAKKGDTVGFKETKSKVQIKHGWKAVAIQKDDWTAAVGENPS